MALLHSSEMNVDACAIVFQQWPVEHISTVPGWAEKSTDDAF